MTQFRVPQIEVIFFSQKLVFLTCMLKPIQFRIKSFKQVPHHFVCVVNNWINKDNCGNIIPQTKWYYFFSLVRIYLAMKVSPLSANVKWKWYCTSYCYKMYFIIKEPLLYIVNELTFFLHLYVVESEPTIGQLKVSVKLTI